MVLKMYERADWLDKLFPAIRCDLAIDESMAALYHFYTTV